VPHQLHVGGIDQVKDVIASAQHGHEAGSLLKELLKALVLGLKPPFEQNLRGRFLTGAKHAADPAGLIVHRRV
jgi:hypothetical protein